MSQPSRPRSRGPVQRRNRDYKIDRPVPLEVRSLMAPVVAIQPLTDTFTAAATPTNADLGTVTVAPSTTAAAVDTMAPITSVSELTPISSFGGDIVTIAAGPGGVFGNDVYAISRGAGDNAPTAVNRPGVIYRVDPATGQASVFFDLNTVLSQTDPNNTTPGTPAANGLLTSTGLVNWYSITFDSEGVFSGTPAMFVSSVSRSDPNKNIIFEIAPNGTLMGVFTQMTDGLSTSNFNINPTAILIPPVQDQSFLSGLIGGSGISSVGGTFAALYFSSTGYSPGQIISNSTLPAGVTQTELGLTLGADVFNSAGTVVGATVTTGPIVGLTAANSDYTSPIYSIFTDFGTPAAGQIPATPGYSGIQGSDGDLLIGGGLTPVNLGTEGSLDSLSFGALPTTFRRFESIAFDQYGYFSQSVSLTTTTGASTTTGGTAMSTFTVTNAAPDYGGSLFVSDLASGLYLTVTPLAPLPTTAVVIPVQSSGIVSAALENPALPFDPTSKPGGIHHHAQRRGNWYIGRPNHSRAAQRFGEQVCLRIRHQSQHQLYELRQLEPHHQLLRGWYALFASDDQGIWQFKTTADLASSTSGTLVGLNDLRTLGVPYDGQNSAVAVVDTGVDAMVPSFRGRVAPGTDLFTGGLGNQDRRQRAVRDDNHRWRRAAVLAGPAPTYDSPIRSTDTALP